MKSVKTTTRVVFCQNVTFQLPTGNPTVTSFTATNPTTDLEYIQLRFLGTNLLIVGTYTVLLSGTITLEFDGSTITGSNTVLVKASGTDAILAFATIYQVTSITHSSGTTITHSSPNVVVPAGNPYVKENYPKSYLLDPTYFIFDVIGGGFTGKIVTIAIDNLNISCPVQSSTLAQSGPIQVDGTIVKYNTAHFTRGAWMDGVPITFKGTAYTSPKAPSTAPIIKYITCELNPDPSFVDVTLGGWFLPTSGTFTAVLGTITVEFAAKNNMTTQTKKVAISTSGPSFVYSTVYSLNSIKHTSVSIGNGLPNFTTPAAPTVSAVSSTLTADQKGMVLTVKGTNLPTTGTFTVKFSSGTTQTATMSGSSSTSSGNSGTIDIFPTGVVSYGTKYTISSIEHSAYSLSGTTGQSFTVPNGPAHVTGVTVSNQTDNAKMSLKLTGADLLTSGTYSFKFSSLTTTFSVGSSSSSETQSVELTVGTGMQLAAGITYTLSTVTHSGGGTVLVGSSISFTTEPSHLTSIVVDGKGSQDRGTCGAADTPCSSIRLGWEVGVSVEEGAARGVALKVKREVEFVGTVEIGERSIQLSSESGQNARLLPTISPTDHPLPGKGALNVFGGQVEISSIVLVFSSASQDQHSAQTACVICGRGMVVIYNVRLEPKGTDRVGMGLAWMSSGRLVMNEVRTDRLWMEDGVVLVDMKNGQTTAEMIVNKCVFSNTQTLNAPLVSFSSSSPSSSITLSSSSFIHTSSTCSITTIHPQSLFSVNTAQSEFTVYECVFTDCGVFTQNGDTSGAVLSITPSSHTPLISFTSCVFTGSFPSSSVAGYVTISISSSLARIRFNQTSAHQLLSLTTGKWKNGWPDPPEQTNK